MQLSGVRNKPGNAGRNWMKPRMFTRRQFLAAALLATPALAVGDARFFEPTWLAVRQVKLDGSKVGLRCVQFSDIHHKGDHTYLKAVVERINSLSPDFVCFTGDIVEDKQFLPEALEILSGIRKPMFGVPGNHEYTSQVSFKPIQECFAATGGAWLMNQGVPFADGKIHITGITYGYTYEMFLRSELGANNSAKKILLVHYPGWADQLNGHRADLILAGHSHGGQVRLPLYGPLVLPYFTDGYDLGLFQTPGGPLYVNPGIGYLGHLNIRFNCRPELTVFEV